MTRRGRARWLRRVKPPAGWSAWLPAAWCAAMAFVVLAPLLGSGYAITRDMVFVPHQPFKSTWLGLDGSIPRAVPSDAFVSLATQVVSGASVEWAVLWLTLFLAGFGTCRLLRTAGPVPASCGATLYVWNAFVFERLAIGHWALLVGYAALPYVVLGAIRVRADPRAPFAWAALVVPLALAAFGSPTGGAVTAVVAFGLVAGADAIATAGALLAGIAVNLPWLVPSLLYRGGIPGSSAGVDVFAAHPDTPFGVFGSLLSLGGIWNSDVVPPGRDTIVMGGAAVAICVVGIVGYRWFPRVSPQLPGVRLAVVSLLLFVVALLPAVSWGHGFMESIDAYVPGAGLLRDSQKWVAPLALVEAIGLAAVASGVGELRERYGRQAVWWSVALGMLVPVVTLPALAWGLAGRLSPVAYPSDWARASYALAQAEGRLGRQHHGDPEVAVLPWSTYRVFSWNGSRPVLDPAPRYFPGDIVVDDDLLVGSTVVSGEDPQSAAIAAVLDGSGNVSAGLRDAGISIVLVEKGTPGLGARARLQGSRVFDGPHLAIWVIGPSAHAPSGPGAGTRLATVLGDIVAFGLFLAAVVMSRAESWRALRRGSTRRYTHR